MTPGLSDFEGNWRIVRQISNASGRGGHFDGRAGFAFEADVLRYREAGLLTLGAAPALWAERAYLWKDGGAGRIKVCFADGRDFHRIDLARRTPSDRHYCAPDIYDVTYDFSAWPNWKSRWVVRGPEKSYTMTSLYQPHPRPGGGHKSPLEVHPPADPA